MRQLVALLLSAVLFPVGLALAAPPAPPLATGQTVCSDASGTTVSCSGTGQDGETRMGVSWTASRFTDNGNGAVTDNLTGLIWLKNANCFGTLKSWYDALNFANSLTSGQCGLSDGSAAGAWRLPTLLELESLVDLSRTSPALPAGHPFTSVQAEYWSSTSPSYYNTWLLYTATGVLQTASPSGAFGFVWPVRGGQ